MTTKAIPEMYDSLIPSLVVKDAAKAIEFYKNVFGATELARFRRKWLTVLAVCVVIFKIAAVLVLRAHYTMDVFAGIFAALWVAHVCERISERSSRMPAGRAG